jgi:hypothetical protein
VSQVSNDLQPSPTRDATADQYLYFHALQAVVTASATGRCFDAVPPNCPRSPWSRYEDEAATLSAAGFGIASFD